ncbi:MAG TPA: response regulator [Candidatus Angelobacter sp.]
MGRIVLCVSKISPAQITRNMILERAGYYVVAIDDPGEAVRVFKTSVVNAVVFGDSVNGDQLLQLARALKALNSAVPIVALSRVSDWRMPKGLVDHQLESLGDPHLLLEALTRALPQDGNGAAQTAPVHDRDQTRQDDNSSTKAASSVSGDGAPTRISGFKAPKKSDL